MRVDLALIAEGNYTTQSGYTGLKTVLQRRPNVDAVFAASDQTALGAIQAARELDRTIPQDIAIVGYDGTPMAAHASPPLTTIRQDTSTAGRLLVDNLLRYLEDGQPTSVVLPVTLVARQSTTG
jgi:DNA-binding LacI/PurR family transcriptional regulator